MSAEIEKRTSFYGTEPTDTDGFASIIQSFLLPEEDLFQLLFSEHFIFYKPRFKSSGDFYWLTTKNQKIFVAVGDSTGHEVHGALVSMAGMYFLNEIVYKEGKENSDEIIELLREKLIQCFQYNPLKNLFQETIDISLCVIDREKMEAQFTGAYNSLYVISNNNLEVYRADRIAVGYPNKENSFFTRQNFSISPGDVFYMFTDGYSDQFGGENRKKFMNKRFSHLLLNIYQNSMDKQKEWLEKNLAEWMQDNAQVDDITVIGFKI
ncbi:MAG: SpoIIE family protein phosphatase [Bacteroidales bacterium]|nr:SpoIIE family protein phosphatase [Bacteroidales bacterium]